VPNDTILAAEGISHTYDGPGGNLQALDTISLSLSRESFVCLVGPSGCGKSTLLRILAGLLSPTAGHVRLEGLAITRPQRRIGIVFQKANLMPWRTVYSNLSLPLELARMPSSEQEQRTAAMLTTFNEIDMGAVMDLRARKKESFLERHGVKLGITSFFVKATIGALKAFPELTAEIDGNELVLKHYYDIGVAIGAEEGLVVPVLRDADRLSFADIEQRIETFARQAKEGTLSLEDLRGGTFTITNGGVFGSLMSTPILNPPQVGILGLHKIEPRPVVVAGEVVVRPMMYVALSYDHRIVDGREAVQFLVRIKQLMEDPAALLLEG